MRIVSLTIVKPHVQEQRGGSVAPLETPWGRPVPGKDGGR